MQFLGILTKLSLTPIEPILEALKFDRNNYDLYHPLLIVFSLNLKNAFEVLYIQKRDQISNSTYA